MARQIGDLPHALEHEDELNRRLEGKRPAVFLDYDGTLTPIVDRPQDALISESMQRAVRELAERTKDERGSRESRGSPGRGVRMVRAAVRPFRRTGR